MTRRELMENAVVIGAALLPTGALALVGTAGVKGTEGTEDTAKPQIITLGKGQFTVIDPKVNPGKPLTVWYYLPVNKEAARCPILFVMHGTLRNGEDYRNQWTDLAQKYGALLLVPEFSSADYPSGKYNRGNVLGANDESPQPPDTWTFAVIERLFDYVKQVTGSRTSRYDIYGHSAGGQFVHRLALLEPGARYRRAVAANAGYYTLPTLTGPDPYPFSLEKTPATPDTLKTDLGRELIVLLGEEDTDPRDPDLYHSPEADKQGLYRLARGKFFYKAGQDAAAAASAKFRWRLVMVPGVGHSNERMAAAAAETLYGK